MNLVSRLCAHAWIVVLLGAMAVVCRIAAVNLARVDHLSNLAGGDTIAAAAGSATGYERGVRKLVLPELNHDSLQWIAQTQLMLATGEWRIRHLDSDNAPVGRATYTPSPYRWWLGAVAWAESMVSGRPIGQAVERAALLAGPVLLLLLLASATLFTARFFGPLAAGLFAAGLVLVFPLGGDFLSPIPGDRVLSQFFLVWAVLPLVAALAAPRSATVGRVLFALAGCAGGVALWLDSGLATVLLFGLVVGGLFAAGRERGAAAGLSLPWRHWAWSAASTSLLAYLIEYAPAHLAGWRLGRNHPLHALALLGLGELLHRGTVWLIEGRRPVGVRAWFVVGSAMLAVALLPVGLLMAGGDGLFGAIGHAARLSLLPGTANVPDLFSWMVRAPELQVVALLLPLALLGVAGWSLWSRPAGGAARAVALAAGLVVVLLAFGGWQVMVWGALDVALLGLLVALVGGAASRSRLAGLAWRVGVAAVLVPGAVAIWPRSAADAGNAVSEAEFEALLQRDLAQWLVARAPEAGALVLAPPAMTSSLNFYGGVRGLCSLDPESSEGFGAAVRICATGSSDEGEALSRKREITHVLVPSWDPFLDEFARLGNNRPDNTLVALLNRWQPPRWLRPVPYVVPQSDGLGERSLAVFEVTELQDQSVALARLAEYFVEMGRLDEAGLAAAALGKAFADDPNAWIARVVVAGARGEGSEVARVLRELRPMLDRGEDADLPWDRRAVLAIVLAQTKQADLAKPRIADCLATVDEARLLQLSTVELFRLQLIGKAYGRHIEDPAVRARALALLPPEMRARL